MLKYLHATASIYELLYDIRGSNKNQPTVVEFEAPNWKAGCEVGAGAVLPKFKPVELAVLDGAEPPKLKLGVGLVPEDPPVVAAPPKLKGLMASVVDAAADVEELPPKLKAGAAEVFSDFSSGLFPAKLNLGAVSDVK